MEVDFCASRYVLVVGYLEFMQMELVALNRSAQFFQHPKNPIRIESVLLSVVCIAFFNLVNSESEQTVLWLSAATIQVLSVAAKLKQAAWVEELGVLLFCKYRSN